MPVSPSWVIITSRFRRLFVTKVHSLQSFYDASLPASVELYETHLYHTAWRPRRAMANNFFRTRILQCALSVRHVKKRVWEEGGATGKA